MRFRVQGVLFDLDGTLVDSTRAIVRAWVRFAGDFGIGVPDLVAARGHGRRAQDVIADLLPADRRAAAFDRVHALELADLDDLAAVPGVPALLAALPAPSWGIVTSGSRVLATARLRAAGLGEHVGRLLVTGDDVAAGKPDPAPYLAGAAALGLAPGDCLAVEDAVAGIVSAAAAGMATLAVTVTTAARELAADAVVSDLTGVTATAGPGGLVVEVDTSPAPREPAAVPGT